MFYKVLKQSAIFSGMAAVFLLNGIPSLHGSQSNFEFLDSLESPRRPWRPEKSPPSNESQDPIDVNLTPFFDEFAKDGTVSVYLGYGHQAYFPERSSQIFEMLKVLGKHFGLALTDWQLDASRSLIQFRDSGKGLLYQVRIEDERNQYINAFATHEIVMYHGHSRRGKGPAFRAFENYFRMGRDYRTLEVDTRNVYFRDEPMMKTDKYPPIPKAFPGETLYYQYRGQKDIKSKLPPTAYTKVIRGLDADLVKASFLPGRQLFYFYSCKNRGYWRDSLRALFPDPNQKLVIGTYRDAFGGTKPEALMIISIVRQLKTTAETLELLNAAKDCEECFTAY